MKNFSLNNYKRLYLRLMIENRDKYKKLWEKSSQ